MTKPKNFPGAINRRRISALQRLPDTEKHDKERVVLQERIIEPSEARNIKTKKFRGKEADKVK